MCTKTLFKVTAVVVCAGLLILSFPTTAQAKENPRFDFKSFIKQLKLLASFFLFSPIDGNATPPDDPGSIKNDKTGSEQLAKITGTLKFKKASTGD